MRELSILEVEAITGGYGKHMPMQNHTMNTPRSMAPPAPISASPALTPIPQRAQNRQTASSRSPSPAFQPDQGKNASEVKLPPSPAFKAPAPVRDMFEESPSVSSATKVYKIAFSRRNGDPISKDVTQKEYDILAEELRKYGVPFTATTLV